MTAKGPACRNAVTGVFTWADAVRVSTMIAPNVILLVIVPAKVRNYLRPAKGIVEKTFKILANPEKSCNFADR